MGYRKYFREILNTRLPQPQRLTSEIEKQFQLLYPAVEFSKTSRNPMGRRLEIAAYFLATIIELEKRGESYDSIRNILLEIAQAYVRPKNTLHRTFKKLPAYLITTRLGKFLIRQMEKRVGQNAHPNGFSVKVLTDPEETLGFGYGIDIVECGICKLFARYRMEKYTSLLCEVDYITSSLAGLTLKRSGTIALGASKCDFRFQRNN